MSMTRALSETVAAFEDSDDFLLAANAFDFDFFVVRLTQRGVRGIDLIRLIRRRSAAGIVALSDGVNDEFVAALDSGADMVLSADSSSVHLAAAMAAVRRRMREGLRSAHGPGPWRLLEKLSVLQAPDGSQIPLSEGDLTIMQCFAAAGGGKVERQVLMERLWGAGAASMENALHATLYRLRKRMEQAGQSLVPVHAVSKVGYEFRAPLVRG
jgi:DNA-binding response OmpR family regulator